MQTDISNEVENQLSCTFKNSGGDDGELWNDVYDNAGSCTDVGVSEYFRLITQFYNKYNPNVSFLCTRPILDAVTAPESLKSNSRSPAGRYVIKWSGAAQYRLIYFPKANVGGRREAGFLGVQNRHP